MNILHPSQGKMRHAATAALVFSLALPALAEDEGRMLPFLGEEARKRGYELPSPSASGWSTTSSCAISR